MLNAGKGLSLGSSLDHLLRLARGPLWVLFGLSIMSNMLMLTGSVFMLQVYDRVLPSRSVSTLLALTALVLVLYGFYALIEWVRARMAVRLGALLHEKLAIPLFEAAIRQRPLALRLESDPVRDLDTVEQFASGMGPISLLDLPWIPLYLALCFLLHPLLGVIATVGAVLLCALLYINELQSRRPAAAVTAAAIERNAQLGDAHSNAESILAMGMMRAVSARWHSSAAALLGVRLRSADRTALFSSITKGFRYFLQSGVLAVGAYLVIEGQLSGGLMIAASILTSRALAPVEQVVSHWRGFVNARQAGQRIEAVLERSAVPVRQTPLPLPTESLAVVDMATGPSPIGTPVAAGVDFQLAAGDGLGIIGLSGSGKSSLVRALVGVWPILRGEVRFDGSEIGHYDAERLGQAIGYMPQTVELFDGTVADNIGHFQAETDPEAVLKAAAAASAHELILSLPDGYDTRIGPGGAILSAGQRQRIGLARALFGNPFLIVLDEPNSNLDAEGDAALTRALVEARRQGAIVIVIAHRPSAIAPVNKLLFMQDGRQVVFGDKDEVLRQVTRRPTMVEERRKDDGMVLPGDDDDNRRLARATGT